MAVALVDKVNSFQLHKIYMRIYNVCKLRKRKNVARRRDAKKKKKHIFCHTVRLVMMTVLWLLLLCGIVDTGVCCFSVIFQSKDDHGPKFNRRRDICVLVIFAGVSRRQTVVRMIGMHKAGSPNGLGDSGNGRLW